MTTKIRRSAGTRSGLEALLSLLRIRPLSPERDIADLRAGVRLQVVCFSPTLGTVRMLRIGKGRTVPHSALGTLTLAADAPVAWRNRRTRETVELDGPFVLAPSEQKAALASYARFALTAGGEQHDLTVRRTDVELLTAALTAAAPAAGAPPTAP